ncbi:uncharacterized protein LOC124159455 [Ischnura elegans]|uniref:uncharacterized protein LOC124159455 n=1 Tax=Ischnura elegans TaxID=197161 RepID=UPI001ED885C2|nr:uncharacterized protein LOC124159455 [Ischnura elegans]
MGKKTVSESSKYREWERERRERLNVSFNDLGSLLPDHDPAVVTSKVEILQKSAAFIRDLKKENSELLLSKGSKLQAKKIKRLQRYVEALVLRVQQLAKLLRDAGISLPPEPPSLSPLGEKILLWSNKISPEVAEKALEAENNSKNVNQKKAKTSKKETISSSKVCPSSKSTAKSECGSSVSKSPSVPETSSLGTKVKSSTQKADKESPAIPAQSAGPRPQESGPPVPVSQLFGDPARILTSLPPQVIGSDQQPGIIVIRATGTSALGTVTQHPPQSTCFVIDGGNCGAVHNGQPSAIVASHPPTLETRPTFVLASNGSLLPVLPTSQFVAQPRQLLVSSSTPVNAQNQPLAQITFGASSSSVQCLKSLTHSLREVKCSPPKSDITQSKKVPIPALPRAKHKPNLGSKEGTEGNGKAASKKKIVGVSSEATKVSKVVNNKSTVKKNKSPVDSSAKEKVTSIDTTPKDVEKGCSEEESSPKKCENVGSKPSKSLVVDSASENKKRELPEADTNEKAQVKRRKLDNSSKTGENISSDVGDLVSNGANLGPMKVGATIGNTELISSSVLPLSGSVSSYSIDALCKMNEKINGISSVKDAVPSRNEKVNSDLNSQKESNSLCIEVNSHSDNVATSEPTSVEHPMKSASNSDPSGVLYKRQKLSGDESQTMEPSSKVTRDNYLAAFPSSGHCVVQEVESNGEDGQSMIASCNMNAITHSEEDSLARNTKVTAESSGEQKRKDESQSSLLPTFGSSQGFSHSDVSFRKEEVGREASCETNPMDESSLPPGAFSSDLFASLQVPSGHSESISPTAAFLLAFPLVSTLTGKTPDLGSDNHHSQPLASLESGGGDNELSSGGCGSSFLQLGNLEENSPSSSSQSILSSLTSSNPSSQSTVLHLKSASSLPPLVPRSEEHIYGHGAIENDIHLVEREVTPSKDPSKTPLYEPPMSSSESAVERCATERCNTKESVSSATKMDSLSVNAHSSKNNSDEYNGTLSRNVTSQNKSEISCLGNLTQAQKNGDEDNQVPCISDQSKGQSDTSAPDKNCGEPCQRLPFEIDRQPDHKKKNDSSAVMFSSSNLQYGSYQLPHISCSSSDLSGAVTTSASGSQNTGNPHSNGSLRQEMPALNHNISTSNLPQSQSNVSFQHLEHSFKSGARSLNGSKQMLNIENNFTNDYASQNPPGSILPPASSTSCFSISSFTSSYPSTNSNSFLSSCVVTNSSPSFSSANTAPLLMTSSSYSSSSAAYPPNSNSLYSNGSSSCVTSSYSGSVAPAYSSSTSFPNSSFPAMSASVSCTPPASSVPQLAKTLVASGASNHGSLSDTYSNQRSSTVSSIVPSSSYSNSSASTMYNCSQKENRSSVSSSQQQSNLPQKNPGVEHKEQSHGNSSAISESAKSHNIFSVDQLNNQNYSYNFNDYSSHVSGFIPQKQESEMPAKKSSAVSSETSNGNLSSRMPGSFSVAHNSSNFSILSWTTLSPMSAAPSSSIDPPINNMNGKGDSYSTSHSSFGLPSGENGPSVPTTTSNNSSSFPASILPETRDISNVYPQYPVGNNNVNADMNGLTGFTMQQHVAKQSTSRGQGSKPRQQVTNWMTAPDPIHSSDFAHNNDVVGSDHARDAFVSGTGSYNANSSFYSLQNQSEMPYVSSSNSTIGGNTILDRSSASSVATGANDNSLKTCTNISEPNQPLGESLLHLQAKPSDTQHNRVSSCTYSKMSNSSTGYIHGSPSELPALPTLVGDLALGSCNSIKGFLPMYDETSPSTSKSGKQEPAKVQVSHSTSSGCGNAISSKENRDGRNGSSNHEYGGSTFLSVSQLVDQVKDSGHQNQHRENDRSSGEKARSHDTSKQTVPSRRNVRQSNLKRDSVVTSKEHQESSQMCHSQIPPHGSQGFVNQGLPSSLVSSNPTHLHAPPIPFPPYNSVHWPVNEMTKVTDNTRSGTSYKSSSSYSAEALIRPSLSTVSLDSRVPDVDMSSYGMDVHKYPIPGGRSELFSDFVDSSVIGTNLESVSLPQNHSKQNTQALRETNDSFRSGHQSTCDKFNYSANSTSSTFHTHNHHSHVPPSFGNNDDYPGESGNRTTALGLSSNCMDFAPLSYSKDSAPITSVMSNVCSSISYSSPSNGSLGNSQNLSHSCRSQEGKMPLRVSNGNCERTSGNSSSVMTVGSSKPDASMEGGSKQLSKDVGISHNAHSAAPFLPMDPSTSSYISHYPPHNHRHHNPSTHFPSGHTMDSSSITSLNGSGHQASKLFPRFPPPSSGVNQLSHQSSSVASGVGSGSHLSSGTLTNFNLSTIFPEINDKQPHHNHVPPSTSSFETSTKSSKLCPVTSAAQILHPPPPLSSSYHHYRPHQHNPQPFPASVDLGSRLPPSHPTSAVLHSNVGFNNLMVQSTSQVNGIGINSSLQPPPPPPFSTPSFTNVFS